MSQLVISGLDPQVLNILGSRAATNGRTVEGEARQILTDAASPRAQVDWTRVDLIRQRLAASKQAFSDSAELLREDRDR